MPTTTSSTALLSWTQLDARLSDTQRLRVSVSADPRDTDHADLTAFTPAASAPRVEQGGWSTGVSDMITARGILVDVRGVVAARARPRCRLYGADAYVMSHQLVEGSYFDQQDRRATRMDGGARLTWSPTAHQAVMIGASVSRSSLDQLVEGSSITMLRSDASVARTITFLARPQAHR